MTDDLDMGAILNPYGTGDAGLAEVIHRAIAAGNAAPTSSDAGRRSRANVEDCASQAAFAIRARIQTGGTS